MCYPKRLSSLVPQNMVIILLFLFNPIYTLGFLVINHQVYHNAVLPKFLTWLNQVGTNIFV